MYFIIIYLLYNILCYIVLYYILLYYIILYYIILFLFYYISYTHTNTHFNAICLIPLFGVPQQVQHGATLFNSQSVSMRARFPTTSAASPVRERKWSPDQVLTPGLNQDRTVPNQNQTVQK